MTFLRGAGARSGYNRFNRCVFAVFVHEGYLNAGTLAIMADENLRRLGD